MAWTLQSLIDGDMTVTAHCQTSPCHHSQRLDLVALRERFGPDWPAMHEDLVPKLKCSRCGGRQIGITVSAKQKGVNPLELNSNGNAYQRAKDGR